VLVVATLGVRCLWMGALAAIPRRPLPRRDLVVLAAGGMRGALSLAGALSIPLMAAHHPFPARDRIIFLVYVIVVGTLVVPSLGLERLIRRLGLGQGPELQRAEVRARIRIVHAGLARLEEQAAQDGAPAPTVDRLRGILELRLARLEARARGQDSEPAGSDDADTAAIARLRREVIAAEREALGELRRRRDAPAQVLARIQRDIDLDEARLHH
jgi:CPA1 family monovalent cation:H+ antiporter